jgi:hypothetical protein
MTARGRADALAMFSEGFCPLCDTPFRRVIGELYRCGTGSSPESVREEIDYAWPVEEVAR